METIGEWWMWAGFAVFVAIAVAVDMLMLRQQGAHKVSVREALGWSALWVALALLFCAAAVVVPRRPRRPRASPISRPPSS